MATVSGLMDYLAGDALTQLAQAYAVRPRPRPALPAPFYTPGPSKPVGTAVKYRSVNGSRESAKVTNPDSPSQVAQGVRPTEEGRGDRLPRALHDRPGPDPGPPAPRRHGPDERADRTADAGPAFVDRFVNIRTNAVHSAIIRGKIDVGSDGNDPDEHLQPGPHRGLLGRHRDAAHGGRRRQHVQHRRLVERRHRIVTKVKTAKQYIAKTYGYRLTDAYYGLNVPEYLAKNTNFKEYLSRFQGFRDQFASTGEIPDGVLGLRWHPVDVADHRVERHGDELGRATTSSGSAPTRPTPAGTSTYECGLPCPSGLVCDKQIADAMQLTPESMGSMFPVRYGTHSYTVFQADPISATTSPARPARSRPRPG
jgi:hypothetical protein